MSSKHSLSDKVRQAQKRAIDNKSTSDAILSSHQKPTGEILEDLSGTGRQRPWKRNKMMSKAVSEAYSRLNPAEFSRYSSEISDCASYLVFKGCDTGNKDHFRKLTYSSFCRCRFCVMCQWRKSLLTFNQVVTLASEHYQRRKTDRALMLTLTVPNCQPEDLNKTLSRMSKAWNSLINNRRYSFIKSWFRGTEVTYNRKSKTFHPHYHILLIVPERYFRKDSPIYVSRDRYLKDWQGAYKDFSITQVDIRAVKKKCRDSGNFVIPTLEDMPEAVAEVAKYATKPSSYIEKQEDNSYYVSETVLEQLHNGMKFKRLVAFGGLFKVIKKEMNIKDADNAEADLLHLGDNNQACACPVCGSDLVKSVYSWKLGFNDYIG